MCWIVDDHRKMFQQQALEVKQNMVHDVCAVTSERVDLVEVCCPWDSPLSAAVIRAGGRAFRMGLHNGYDLTTKAGLAKAVRKLKELRPRYLHVSPPCFPWSSATNGALGNPDTLAKLLQNRKQGRKILKGCLKLIEVQRQEIQGQSSMCSGSSAGHAGGEHPLCAHSWKEPSMRRMVALCGGEKFRVDGCRFGMYSKRAEGPIQKPWGWFSSSQAIRKAIQKRCLHEKGQHVVMNNHEKVSSATYPPKLCRTIAKVITNELGTELYEKARVYALEEQHELAKRRKVDHDHLPGEQHVWDDRAMDELGNQDSDHVDPRGVPEVPNHPESTDPEASPRVPVPKPDSLENKLRAIHANLGHPSNQVLVRTVKLVQRCFSLHVSCKSVAGNNFR